MTLLGWDIRQWARATAILERKPKTLRDALEVHREWLSKWHHAPSSAEVIVTDHERKMDYDTACDLFKLQGSW